MVFLWFSYGFPWLLSLEKKATESTEPTQGPRNLTWQTWHPRSDATQLGDRELFLKGQPDFCGTILNLWPILGYTHTGMSENGVYPQL